MSVHSSLVTKASLKRHRNVLKRDERIELLIEQGKWQDGDSVFDLPKVKGEKKIKKSKGGKKKKEDEAEEKK